MQNKKILLGISVVHGISELIEENLKYYGFDVVNIARNDTEQNKFRYPTLWDRLAVLFKKGILRDKDAKRKLQSKLLLNDIQKEILSERLDYALFFLANNYQLDFLDFIKKNVKSGGMINYQWDGLDRFKSTYESIPLFDRFFVFDPEDLNKANNLLPATSFYFDMDLEPLPAEYDFYYLGAHRNDRCDLTIKFANFAKENNYNLNMNIVIPPKEDKAIKLYPNNVNILKPIESKPFKENLLSARKAKVLLDFVLSEHNGLSLRTFEALGHNKKLITTNKDIVKYDFYHPNNIFVLDDNFDEIQAFLSKPYYEIEENIKKKYSFGNWINYILDIKPYQEILLPK